MKKLLLAVALLITSCLASGSLLDRVVEPGQTIQGHAKVEADCTNCHQPGKKNDFDAKCLSCHKDINRDVVSKTRFHGKLKPQSCVSCHTDHKGRNAKIVILDKTTFDHSQTAYQLIGKHVKPTCDSCHTGSKYRGTAVDCIACHKKNDTHKTRYGTKCESCHAVTGWKDISFDHDRDTKFQLNGKHESVKCDTCHKGNLSDPLGKDCISCHKKDDTHKGTLGADCVKCHTETSWKDKKFDHSKTKFPLLGKHEKTACKGCHLTPDFKAAQTDCYSCHKKDDTHKGSLGVKCETCHNASSWKISKKFDHSTTKFPLLGKHEDTKCDGCHLSKVYKDAPKECSGCHQKDDKHKGRYGLKCDSCHNANSWKEINFFHDRDTRYPLRWKHVDVKCDDCHKGNLYTDKLASDCISCHKKDDKHEGQEGTTCEDCHNERDWKNVPKFDHDLTKFPLLGKHSTAKCSGCHETPRYKDAKSDCISCHKKDDAQHKGRLGTRCDSCHSANNWKEWQFDHNKTRFKLVNGHYNIACESCHKKVTEDLKLPTNCYSCHSEKDVHDGKYGRTCEKCHNDKKWSEIRR